MTRNDRNRIISECPDLTATEKSKMINISGVIGDSNIIDIDWDDLSEATEIEDISEIEELLDILFDLNILEELDYDQGIMG